MTARLAVLEGMLALQEFTAADLAGLTGVRPSTVRTVLSREKELVERVGSQATGRAGGQEVLYRLTDDGRSLLLEETGYAHLGHLHYSKGSLESIRRDPTIPIGIVATEQYLNKLAELGSDRARRRTLLNFAETSLASGQAELDRLLQGAGSPLTMLLLRERAQCLAKILRRVKAYLEMDPEGQLKGPPKTFDPDRKAPLSEDVPPRDVGAIGLGVGGAEIGTPRAPWLDHAAKRRSGLTTNAS